jgi:hypothetical protein
VASRGLSEALGWPDRLGADVGRALVLGSIPITVSLGFLSIGYLSVVAFLVGVLTVFFDVAYQSFIPVLVRREQLVDANSKLEISNSLAQIAGPGVAGSLIQLLTAPVTLLLDMASFVVSVVSLALIRTSEPRPIQMGERPNLVQEIGEGLRVVLGNPLLRAIAGCTATSNLFSNVLLAVYVLYLTRDLQITPALLGRMNATMRFFVWGTMPLGSLLGGFLGVTIGLRPTLWLATVGMLLAFLWVFFSPVRSLRDPPPTAAD